MPHLNYCRQMLAEIGDVTDSEEDSHIWVDLTKRLRRAVKFILPEGGVTMDDFELRALGDEDLHLPFEIIALEFPLGEHPNGRMVKVITLCEQSEESIRVTPMVGMTGEPWKLQPCFDLPARNYADKTTEMWGLKVPEEKYGVAMWVLLFLNALACSNVQAIKSQATNKPKRHALPFDDYRILTIEAVGRPSITGAANPHRSPREHLRRGHIRRLQDGRKFWINATVVNPGVGGKVTKDYRLTA